MDFCPEPQFFANGKLVTRMKVYCITIYDDGFTFPFKRQLLGSRQNKKMTNSLNLDSMHFGDAVPYYPLLLRWNKRTSFIIRNIRIIFTSYTEGTPFSRLSIIIIIIVVNIMMSAKFSLWNEAMIKVITLQSCSWLYPTRILLEGHWLSCRLCMPRILSLFPC